MNLKFISVIAVVAVTGYVAIPIPAEARGTASSALKVSCSKVVTGSFSTIGAAISALHAKGNPPGSMITVTGACHENVVIQSLDRLTLNTLTGASITDVSGGNLFVIDVEDSRGVSIDNFTINGLGIGCADGSLCRLNNNTIQAVDTGVFVFMSQAVVTGGSVQGASFAAINVIDGSSVDVTGVMITNNPGNGIQIQGQSFVRTDSTIANNGGAGGFLTLNATLRCLGCQITGNGAHGLIAKRDSSVRFQGPYVVTGNTQGGVQITESSSVFFSSLGTVTGNTGGMDVFCSSTFATARGATTNIGGGTTNCAEPPE